MHMRGGREALGLDRQAQQCYTRLLWEIRLPCYLWTVATDTLNSKNNVLMFASPIFFCKDDTFVKQGVKILMMVLPCRLT